MRRVLLLALMPAAFVAACGWEDIDLAPLAGADAGVTSVSDGAAADGGDLGAPGDAGEAGALACDASGSTCHGPGADPGAPCTARADCCTGECEPITGAAGRVCLAECRPDGVACARASDCCGFDCTGGTCGGALCLVKGESCTQSSQCCSNVCDAASGHCVLNPAGSCRPTGEDCGSGAESTCCGTCNVGERCDPGPGPCRLPGTPCVAAADCCEGTCTDDGGTGTSVCTSACLANGAPCRAGLECCAGACVGDPGQCGPPSATCASAR